MTRPAWHRLARTASDGRGRRRHRHHGDDPAQRRLVERLDEAARGGTVVTLDEGQLEVERLAALERHGHQSGDDERGDDADDDRRPVTEPLAEVLRRDRAGRRARVTP